MELHERGIIGGFPDGTFKPGQQVTRGQAAKILAGVLQLDTVNVTNPNFKDIPTSHPYYGAIAALKQAGIIDGYADGTFKSSKPIQRKHMAKIIAGALHLQAKAPNDLPFTDVTPVYKDAIAALYENNITTGRTPTTFGGNDTVRRGQLAAFVVRAEQAIDQSPKEVTLTIDSITGDRLVTADAQYKIGEQYKEFLNEANKAALTGATISATIVKNEIVNIEWLQLNASGTQENTVKFDGGGATFAGDVFLDRDYIALENIKISGEVVIQNSAATSIHFSNVEVAGEVNIEGAKASPTASLKNVAELAPTLTIYIVGSTVPNLSIQRLNVVVNANQPLANVVLTGQATNVTINATVNFLQLIFAEGTQMDITGTGTIRYLEIPNQSELKQNILLHWIGNIQNLTVLNPNATLTINPAATIDLVVIPVGVLLSEILSNSKELTNAIITITYTDGSPAIDSGSNPGGESEGGTSGETGGGSGGGTGGGTGGGSGTTPMPIPNPGTNVQFVSNTKTSTNADKSTLGFAGTSTSSSNQAVATAIVESSKVKITSKSPGTATITVTDAEGRTATIPVIVANDGKITIGQITKYASQSKTITASQLAIVGKSISISTQDIAETTIDSAGTVTVKAKAPGQTTITVTDNLGRHATITVEVLANGEVTATENPYTPGLTDFLENTVDTFGFVATSVSFNGAGIAAQLVSNETTNDTIKIIGTSGNHTGTLIVKGADNKEIEIPVSVTSQDTLQIDTSVKYNTTPREFDLTDIGFKATTADSSAVDTLTVQVVNGHLELTGVKPGSSVVTLTDATGKKKAIVTVAVLNNGVIEADISTAYENKKTTVQNNDTTLGFIAKYAFTNNLDVATAIVTTNDTIQITAVGPGSAKIIVKDDDNRIAIIPVTVDEYGTVSANEVNVKKYLVMSEEQYDNTVSNFGFKATSVDTTGDTVSVDFNTGETEIIVSALKPGSSDIIVTSGTGRVSILPVTVTKLGKIKFGSVIPYSPGEKRIAVNDSRLGLVATAAVSDDESYVVAQIDNGEIVLTAEEPGNTTITVTAADGKAAIIEVTVQPTGEIVIDKINGYKQADSKTITNNVAKLGIIATTVISTQDVATVTINDNIIIVEANKPGTETVIVVDEKKRHASFDVQVDANGKITLKNYKKFVKGTHSISDNLNMTANEKSYSTVDVVDVTFENNNIVVTAVAPGSTTVTLTDGEGRYATFEATVGD